jgi:hypothetical protein
MTLPAEPTRPLWFKLTGFLLALGLILAWWLWAQSWIEHAVVVAGFFAFLAVGRWANISDPPRG